MTPTRTPRPPTRRQRADTDHPPHGDPYHVCVTCRPGVEVRHRIPNFVVVEHVCGQKPRFRWLAPLPDAEPTLERLIKQRGKRLQAISRGGKGKR